MLYRVLTLVISFAMLLSFAACQSGEEETQSKGESKQETESKIETESVLDVPVETSSETEPETETEEQTSLILGDDVASAADFTVSGVFGDNMVLQRGEYIRVWGWANESENGKKVSASFLGYRADALVEDGAWEIVICEKLPANPEMGNKLSVFTESKTVEFADVLVGDVFLVIGQSNVQYSISHHLEYAHKDPKWKWNEMDESLLIRMNYNSNTDSVGYPTRGTTEVCPDVVTNNGWVIPTKSNIMRYTALGYFTALKITELTENKIPVGISQFSADGRTLSVFMPNHLAEQYQSDHFDEEKGIYIGNYHNHVITRYMYNHYLYPYERMPIAGIVWCQGETESTAKLSSVYAERFTALMTYMRSTHNLVNPDFPIFMVEFPSVYRKPQNYTGAWSYLDTGVIRAVQGTLQLSLPNTYFAASSDFWNDANNANNIHPAVKYEQAERIVALMDAVIYGGKTLDEATGPILESYEISSDNLTVTLKFKNVGEGLRTTDGGTAVKGFLPVTKKNLLSERYEFTAEITAPDTITFVCEKPIAGVAYHAIAEYFYGTDINLCDSYGNPATAFWVYEK